MIVPSLVIVTRSGVRMPALSGCRALVRIGDQRSAVDHVLHPGVRRGRKTATRAVLHESGCPEPVMPLEPKVDDPGPLTVSERPPRLNPP